MMRAKSGKNTSKTESSSKHKAKKVPGGWRLPGDATLYPYDPGLPPDRVTPRIRRKHRVALAKRAR